MTREEAKVLLYNISAYDIDAQRGIAKQEAIEIAIKALEQEPCIQEKQANADKIDAVYIDGFKAGYSQARFDLEQEPCEDAVSREDALMALTGEWTESTDELIHRFIKRIKNLPSVNPQPKTGRWIKRESEIVLFECSVCKDGYIDQPTCMGEPMFKYCPCCGAKMAESEDK